MDELEELLRVAEENAETERLAAVTVQRLYRGATARSIISTQAAACRTIQRVYRGHRGRVRANEAREDRAALEESSVYHYYATIIQRVFKGYYSRRYFHDFFARKAYIESIKKKSEELRQQLDGHMEAQIEKEQDRAEEQAREEFKKVTQNLHHLLSTASTPGVYNPPYVPEDMIPTAFDVPVEEHLRRGVKDFLKTNGLRRVKPSTYAARSRLSVQASSKYGVIEEEKRSTRHYSKLRHLSAEPFVAGSKPKPRPVPGGISLGVEYEEPWRLSRSVRELEHHPSQKAKRVDQKPFHTSVINNRLFEEYERGKSRRSKKSRRGRQARTGGLNDGTMRSMTLASEHTAK